MRQQQLAKQPINYAVNEKQEQCQFEQKPIKNFDEFSDGEEQEFKESDLLMRDIRIDIPATVITKPTK